MFEDSGIYFSMNIWMKSKRPGNHLPLPTQVENTVVRKGYVTEAGFTAGKHNTRSELRVPTYSPRTEDELRKQQDEDSNCSEVF